MNFQKLRQVMSSPRYRYIEPSRLGLLRNKLENYITARWCHKTCDEDDPKYRPDCKPVKRKCLCGVKELGRQFECTAKKMSCEDEAIEDNPVECTCYVRIKSKIGPDGKPDKSCEPFGDDGWGLKEVQTICESAYYKRCMKTRPQFRAVCIIPPPACQNICKEYPSRHAGEKACMHGAPMQGWQDVK